MGDFRHGASAYANGLCRCDECTAAARSRLSTWRGQRHAARVRVDGRLVAPLPDESHGRPATYSNHGCRCLECVAAWSDRMAENYRSRKHRQDGEE